MIRLEVSPACIDRGMMAKSLVPLLLGFLLHLASSFTARYSRIFGERGGRMASLVLRVILGMPFWILGLSTAVRTESPLLFSPNPFLEVAARLMGLISTVVVILGILSLGLPAAMPSLRDAVVLRRIYGRIRHPIYAGAILGFTSLALLKPTLVVLIACASGIVWLNILARCEEHDLLQRMPEYRAYMNQVPRFIPRLPGR